MSGVMKTRLERKQGDLVPQILHTLRGDKFLTKKLISRGCEENSKRSDFCEEKHYL